MLGLAGILLLVSTAARGQASLVGYVRDESTLRGLQGAELSVDGSDKRVRTDKEGKYNFRDLPAGAARVHVRLVGFAPVDTIFDLADGKTTENVFFLGKQAVALDTVVTNARERRLAGAGFASFGERQAKGFGKFLDSTFLRENEHRHLSDLVNGLNGLDAAVPGTCHGGYLIGCSQRVAVSRRNAQSVCFYQVVMDGTVIAPSLVIDNSDLMVVGRPPTQQELARREAERARDWSKTFDLNSINVASLRGVEIYRSASEAPEVYGGQQAACGVVVLWTRRG